MKLADIEEIKNNQKIIIDQQGNEHHVFEIEDFNKIRAFDLTQLVPLLPCPCCHSKAEIVHIKASQVYKNPVSKYETLWSVQCTKCGLRTGDYSYSPYRAIETWNFRNEGLEE